MPSVGEGQMGCCKKLKSRTIRSDPSCGWLSEKESCCRRGTSAQYLAGSTVRFVTLVWELAALLATKVVVDSFKQQRQQQQRAGVEGCDVNR